MNRDKIIYWAGTSVLCLIMTFSAFNYFFHHEMVVGFYENLGYPTYLIYPSAILKILGIIAILSKKSKMLKEWAYVGFFFDMVLALAAHLMVDDGAGAFASIGLIGWFVSYIYDRKLFPNFYTSST